MDRYDIDRDTAVLTEGDACNLVREGIFAMGRTPKIFKPPPLNMWSIGTLFNLFLKNGLVCLVAASLYKFIANVALSFFFFY